MKVIKDGVVMEIADVAVNAAIRNGYEIVKDKAVEDEKPKKPKKK